MAESHNKSPKFCKVHRVSKGVALHHTVTHCRITCQGSTPASISVHSKDVRFSETLLPEKQRVVATAGQPMVKGKPNKISSARLKAHHYDLLPGLQLWSLRVTLL